MRRAAKIDENQNEIVKMLRDIPGVEVEPNHQGKIRTAGTVGTVRCKEVCGLSLRNRRSAHTG